MDNLGIRTTATCIFFLLRMTWLTICLLLFFCSPDWDAINSTLYQLRSLVTPSNGYHGNHNTTTALLSTFVTGIFSNSTLGDHSVADVLARYYNCFYAQRYF